MKTTYHILIFLLLYTAYVNAQEKINGIYKTPDDFLNGKLTHQSIHSKIRLHETFKRELLEVKTSDSTFSYLKKDVFGYVDKKGSVYRFFNNSIYPVLNPGEKIVLYSLTSGTGMKNSPVVVTHYFSKDAYSPIMMLTLRNIETVFAGQLEFEKLVEIHFMKDSDLLEYDGLHKMYKLNRLYELSKTPKD